MVRCGGKGLSPPNPQPLHSQCPGTFPDKTKKPGHSFMALQSTATAARASKTHHRMLAVNSQHTNASVDDEGMIATTLVQSRRITLAALSVPKAGGESAD
jgi:hypothetical protein